MRPLISELTTCLLGTLAARRFELLTLFSSFCRSVYWNYTAHATEPYTQSASFSMQPSEVWGVA